MTHTAALVDLRPRMQHLQIQEPLFLLLVLMRDFEGALFYIIHSFVSYTVLSSSSSVTKERPPPLPHFVHLQSLSDLQEHIAV